MGQPQISVLILTLNEGANLQACLESVSWCDDVVVFDSFSTDSTERIAGDSGARFVQRKFDDYASQRNAALDQVDYKHPWVFMLDADERFTPELAEEIADRLPETAGDVSLFRLRRKDMFMGRWIKRSSGYPTWFGRLMRLGRAQFQRKVHEDVHTQDREQFLSSHMLHHPFSKGLKCWLRRHNQYSTVEAGLRLQGKQSQLRLRDVFSREPATRRRAAKKLAYSLPLRPTLVFLYLYVCRLGIIDGRAGLRYCLLRSMYEYMIDLKIRELKRRAKNLPM